MIELMLFSVISLIGFTFSFAILRCKLTSPLSLHVISWGMVNVIGLFFYDQFIDFPETSLYALITWYSIVTIILSMGEVMLPKNSINQKNQNIEYICLKYWKLAFPICLYTAYEIYVVGSNGPASFFLNLRLANTLPDYSWPNFTVMTAVYPFMMALFAISVFTSTTKLNKISIYSWVILFAIGTMGKFAILTPIIVFAIIIDITKGISKKKLFIAIPILITVIFSLHFLRLSSGDSSTIASVLGVYIYSPILALGKLNIDVHGDFNYTFRFIYAFLNKATLSSEAPVSTILDYVDVPVKTNVYTVMQPFYQDSGIPGVAIGAIIYGLFFSSIYLLASNGSVISLLIYSLMGVSLFTSFITETLITNLAGNVKISICVALLWMFTVKKFRIVETQGAVISTHKA